MAGSRAGRTTSARQSIRIVDILDGESEFPWRDIKFFIPDWLPTAVQNHVQARINKAGGLLTGELDNADVILSHAAISDRQARKLGRHDNVKTGRSIVAMSHWLAQVFFLGISVLPPKGTPAFASLGEGSRTSLETPLVAVADLGDEELRLRVMVALEMNGAIVVDYSDCSICILPSGHEYLKDPALSDREDVQYRDADWVFGTVTNAKKHTSRSHSSKTKGKLPMRPPESPLTSGRRPGRRREEDAYDPDESPRSRRNVTHPSTRSQAHARVEFTSEDRDLLARWLAYHRPAGPGRTSRSLYVHLQDNDDPACQWANRHPWSAWHEHYRRNKSIEWRDGTILDQLIDNYVERGINASLKTRDERGATTTKKGRNVVRVVLRKRPRVMSSAQDVGIVAGSLEPRPPSPRASSVDPQTQGDQAGEDEGNSVDNTEDSIEVEEVL